MMTTLTQRKIVSIICMTASLLTVSLIAVILDQSSVKAEPSCTHYVATDGSDSNPGTEVAPWRTIQHAADVANPGDTFCIQSGSYEERIDVTRSGEQGKPISFIAQGAVHNHGYKIRADWITVIGFEMTMNGVSVKGKHCQIQDNNIHNLDFVGIDLVTTPGYRDNDTTTDCIIHGNTIAYAVKAGIRLMGQNHLIENNDISHTLECSPYSSYCDDADGIRFFGSHHTIRGNYIHDILHEPENLSDPHIDCFQTWHTAHHILFEGNTCFSPNTSKSNQILMLEEMNPDDVVSDLTFRNNLFIMSDPGYVPMNFHQKRSGDTIDNIVVVHNTFIHPDIRGIGQYAIALTRVRNALIQNNIFYNYADGSKGNTYILMDGESENINTGYNLVYNDNGVQPAGGPFPNDLWMVDPLFVDYASGDYRLQSGSHAVDTGVDIGVTLDFDGNTRPQGAGFDMGAFEHRIQNPEPGFIDVPLDHPYYDEIEALRQAGYITGCSVEPLMYCPERTMTRAESAVFVERGIHGADHIPPHPTGQIFTDVPLNEWYAKWAIGLWNDGYTAGCNADPLMYCPMQEHTRTEGTVFFLRMLNGPAFEPPDPQGIFTDVTLDFWGARWIEAAYNAGLIPACETEPALKFCPEDPLDRAMAAYMMVQAKELSTK
ncbi:MAG: hypothetical protein GTO18_04985 [Anaerolineales bacterium]|nr:hypothetical protein [Anaerolineales bacterium]